MSMTNMGVSMQNSGFKTAQGLAQCAGLFQNISKLIGTGIVILMLAGCATQSKVDETQAGPAVPGSAEDLRQNVGDRVFFDYDSYSLTAASQATLERQAEWLRTYSNVKVTIEGHCDERGTREYNLALGARRANAAKNYLVGLGIPSHRVDTISYGKERPEQLGSNESAWSQNRRSVTVVTSGASS